MKKWESFTFKASSLYFGFTKDATIKTEEGISFTIKRIDNFILVEEEVYGCKAIIEARGIRK